MNENTLADIRGLIAKGSGLDSSVVIPAHDGGPLPSGLFASVFVLHDRAVGLPSITQLDGVQLQSQTREAIVSVEWLRAGAYDAGIRFMSWAVSDVGRQDIRALGITIDEHSPVADNSQVLTDDYEARADCQLRVGYFRLAQYDTGALDVAPVSINDRPGVDIRRG